MCGMVMSYLISRNPQTIPVHAGKHIANEFRLEIKFLLFKLGVVEVQGERGSGGFAFFDGAGDEVGCDDFHCAGGGVEVG